MPNDLFTITPPLTTAQTIAIPILLTWIIIETARDFRDQNIPLFFSLIPLLAGIAYWGTAGAWLPAVMIAALVAVTNLPPTPRLVATAVVSLIAYTNIPNEFFPLFVGFMIVFVFFHLNIMGGADALAAVYMLLWFPYWGMLAGLLIGMLLAAFGIIAYRFRKSSGKQIFETIRGEKSGTRAPSLIGFALGAFGFFLMALPLAIQTVF